MDSIHFEAARVAVREDIAEAHARAWQRLASPGAWWTGAERVAIAAEVRAAGRCALCREARQALSPFSVTGQHDSASDLSDAAIDAVHRIVTDPSRLTKTWVEKLAAEGLDDARYVELTGVVVTVLSIDVLCLAIGAELHPLPTPLPGEPSRVRPGSLEDAGAFVPMMSTGAGKRTGLWEGPIGANVIRALSLVPDEVRQLRDIASAQYLPDTVVAQPGRAPGRSLDRAQIELLAARVSALNECFY